MGTNLSCTTLKHALFLEAESVSGVGCSYLFFFDGFDDDFDLGEAVLGEGEVAHVCLPRHAQLHVLLRSIHNTDDALAF